MCQCNAMRIPRCSVYRATLKATGCRHWASILHRIVLAGTMVINFGAKLELWHCEIAFQSSVWKASNGPSAHQLINATSCIKRSNTIIKAKEFSSYQMYTTDNNWGTFSAPKNLVEKFVVMTANNSKALNTYGCIHATTFFMLSSRLISFQIFGLWLLW
jgi:hypothetical protein